MTTTDLVPLATPALRTEGDRAFADLVADHFRDHVARNPGYATQLGIHDHDDRLADLSRGAILGAIETERRFEGALAALDPAGLSPETAFERELALHAARRRRFTLEEHRAWERRANAVDEVADAYFFLLARPFAPIAERLDALTGRLDATPAAIGAVRDRLGSHPVRLWLAQELDALAGMPELIGSIVEAGAATWPSGDARLARLERAAAGALAAFHEHGHWLRAQLGRADGGFALGRDRLEALIGLRAFDGLDGDAILSLGETLLARAHAERAAAAREMAGSPSEAEAVDRVKSDHPATFDEALDAYRDAMVRARAFILERGLMSIPANERLEVVATPGYLRASMPFAAYLQPGPFDADHLGTYLVTPSVDGDPRAIREHNRASISNTSIHEAYPGHHLQLTAALERPTLSRILVDAPELVEGWGMYSELLMREHRFDATPEHRVALATDVVWRACRIVLDIRLHRGEIGVPEAIDLLIAETGFERPNATAEVHRYTSTPTYQLSYLLGRELILRLRSDEQRRLEAGFSLRRFHDALLWSGSIPVSFHRRLLAGEGGGPFLPAA